MDFTALKAELLDPKYNGLDDKAIAAILNTENLSTNKKTITGQELGKAIVKSEYTPLTETQKGWVIQYATTDYVDPFGFAAVVFDDVFGSESATIAALKLLRVEDKSWASDNGYREITAQTIREARGHNE